MSEVDFHLYLQIFNYIAIVLQGLCLLLFVKPFMAGKESSKRRQILKETAVFVIYFIAYGLFGKVDFLPMGFSISIVIISMVGISLLFKEKKEVLYFYLTFLYFCINNLSFLIVESLSYLFSEKWVIVQVEGDKLLLNMSLNYGLTILLRIVLMGIMLYFVQKVLKHRSREIRIKELCYLLLTPIIGVLFGNVIMRILYFVNEDRPFILYEEYPIFLWLVPGIAILVYMGLLVTILLWKNLIQIQEEQSNYFVKEQQMESLQRRVEEVEHFYDGIRRMKHEMRNHMTNIKGLAEFGNYDEMEHYISKMDESISALDYTILTGNPVTDVIINDKKKSADKMQIMFYSEFYFPKGDNYNTFDVGIILNNLLQNALEACEKQISGKRYINIVTKQKKKFFFLEVRNSFDGEMETDRATGLPISTKENGKSLHGIGLLNVRREVEKYMGNMEIKIDKDEFCVMIMLQEIKDKG